MKKEDMETSVLSGLDGWHYWTGQFLLNFGMVEHLVFVLLRNTLPGGVPESLRDANLELRWERLLKLLPADEATAKWRKSLEEQTQALTEMRRMRNRLAHGFLLETVAEDLKSATCRIVQVKDWDRPYEPEVWSLSYDELANACQKLNPLIEALSGLAGFQERA
jgi:hypothetical protein